VTFEVRAGEIVGVAGVDGNGQSELIDALTGLRKAAGGQISVGGQDLTHASARQALDAGMGTFRGPSSGAASSRLQSRREPRAARLRQGAVLAFGWLNPRRWLQWAAGLLRSSTSAVAGPRHAAPRCRRQSAKGSRRTGGIIAIRASWSPHSRLAASMSGQSSSCTADSSNNGTPVRRYCSSRSHSRDPLAFRPDPGALRGRIARVSADVSEEELGIAMSAAGAKRTRPHERARVAGTAQTDPRIRAEVARRMAFSTGAPAASSRRHDRGGRVPQGGIVVLSTGPTLRTYKAVFEGSG